MPDEREFGCASNGMKINISRYLKEEEEEEKLAAFKYLILIIIGKK